jgi:hypothetical protein
MFWRCFIMTRHPISFVAWLALVAAIPCVAYAAKPAARHFKADLSGAEEVPSRDTRGHGIANFHLNPDGTELRFHAVVNGIDNVFAAHIHRGAPGVNGQVVFGFFGAPAGGGRFNGVLAHGTVIRGVTPLPNSLNPPGVMLTNAEKFDALIALMRSGDSYVNVHTNDGVAPTDTGPGDFPGGEIRGQVDPNP